MNEIASIRPAAAASQPKKTAPPRPDYAEFLPAAMEISVAPPPRVVPGLILTMTAPIAGTVQQLAVTSVGQVVNPGQPLLVIVPDKADLIVEALVPSQEIGFVDEGDDVVVKADAFPFTRYGAIEGKVADISEDALTIRDAQGLQDVTATVTGQSNSAQSGAPAVTGLFYIAKIKLNATELKRNGHTLKLEPGMTVRAEIKTESRRVIDYLLSPVTQVLDESGHET